MQRKFEKVNENGIIHERRRTTTSFHHSYLLLLLIDEILRLNELVCDIKGLLVFYMQGFIFKRLTATFDQRYTFFGSIEDLPSDDDFIDAFMIDEKEGQPLPILSNGHYSLRSLILEMSGTEKDSIYYKHHYGCIPDLPIFLKSTHEYLLSDDYNVILSPIKDNKENDNFNRKNIALNMITQRLLMRASSNEVQMFKYMSSRHCKPTEFEDHKLVDYERIGDLFPFPSSALTCYGSFKLRCKRKQSFMMYNVVKHCEYCQNFSVFDLDNDEKNEIGIVKDHSSCECPLTALKLRKEYTNSRFIAALDVLRNFDERVEKYNDYVKKHAIIEDLKKEYPFINFPDSYIEALFYYDGCSPYIPNRSTTISSTLLRYEMFKCVNYEKLIELCKSIYFDERKKEMLRENESMKTILERLKNRLSVVKELINYV